MPVGTAKCYAHRGRASLRERLTRMTRRRSEGRRSRQILPHRPPFLLIDEVLELVPGERVAARKTVTEEDCAGHFPGNPIMPGVKMVEALAQCGAVAVLSQPENEGRLVLFAGIDDVRFKRIVRPGEVLDLLCEVEAVRGPVGKGKVRASVGGELAVRGTLTFAVSGGMIGRATGRPVSITGLGCYVPERVVTNDDLAEIVDTSDEWIRDPHRHPRAADRRRRPRRCPTSALPAARAALAQAGVDAAGHRPDHRRDDHARTWRFPATAALVADQLGSVDAAAYDLSAGCTGFMYALAQAHAAVAAGLAQRALVIGGDVLSKVLDWTDRSTLVLFGDGAGAVVLEHVDEGGFLGFELGADGGGRERAQLSRAAARASFDDGAAAYLQMNGREVFKFATRILVSSAQAISGRMRAARSTTSTSTFRTRRTSASSTTLSTN